MNALTLLVSLFLCPEDAVSFENQGPSVLRTYDIGALTRSTGQADDCLSMLPYVWGTRSNPGGDEFDNEPTPVLGEDLIVELVRHCIQPSVWDQEGNSLEVSDGQLWVRSAATVQQEVERLLTFLTQALLSRQRLVVTLYRGRIPASSALRTVAEADRILAAAVDAGTLRLDRSTSVPVTPGRFLGAGSTQLEYFVYDYEVEIAQGANIADPILQPLQTGLTLSARVSQSGAGSRVDVLMRQSERLDSSRAVDLGARAQLNNKTAVESMNSMGAVERPEVAFTSFASSFQLATGQAAWIESWMETELGTVDTLIDLRLVGSALPANREYRFNARDYEDIERAYVLRLQDVGSRTLPRIKSPVFSPFLFDVQDWDEPYPFIACSDGRISLSIDALSDAVRCGEAIFDEDETCMLLPDESGLLISVTPPDSDLRLKAATESILAPGASFSVQGVLRVDGKVAGGFRFPVCDGASSSLWSGVQTTGVFDWDVDVANESMCSNPEMFAIVDGLALSLGLGSVPGGEYVLELGGKVNRLLARPSDFPLRTQTQVAITKAPTRTMAIEENLPWSPGSTLLRFGDRHLALELALEAVR